MRRYAVVGSPILHSRSPAMHNAAFDAIGLDAIYEARETEQDRFGDVADALRAGELAGVNVTMPHKRNAYEAVDVHATFAVRSGAVNTITVSDDTLTGHNTDGHGVAVAVSRLELSPETPVLILGGGGAARAAITVLADRRVAVSARRTEAVEALIEGTGVDAEVVEWSRGCDGFIVVNATPIGMRGESLPPAVTASAAGLVDMAYGPEITPAVRAATSAGIPVSDGITMLVGQAVAAFELFTGVTPSWDVMETAARERQPHTRMRGE